MLEFNHALVLDNLSGYYAYNSLFYVSNVNAEELIKKPHDFWQQLETIASWKKGAIWDKLQHLTTRTLQDMYYEYYDKSISLQDEIETEDYATVLCVHFLLTSFWPVTLITFNIFN